MARRRREVSPEAGTAQEDATPAIEGPGPQATLTMRGSAADVKRQMGVGTEKQEPEKKKDTNGGDDEKQKFIDALRNPRFLVRVRRQSPRALAGHCWDVECPIPYTKLQDETKSGWGGGTFRAVIVDPESNKTITGDTFDIPGEAVTPEEEMSAEEQQKVFMQGGPKTPAEMTVDGLNRRAEVTAKMLEVESLEAQLEEQRSRRDGKGKAPPPQDNSRIDELARALAEAKHQAELESRDRKHAEELRSLKEMIAQNAQPKKAEGDNMMTVLLEQMREDRKQSQSQFTALLTQMKDDKLNAVLDEVKSIRNKPTTQATSLLDQAEAILKLKKVFGWGQDDDDEEEADDKDDDRPWWERALDKLGGKLGDKLFEKFTNMEEKGEKVDREKFMAEMAQHADLVAAEAIAKQQRPGLPAPAPQATLPVPPPAPRPRPASAPQAATLPPPPPPATDAQQPTLPPPPAPEVPVKMTIEQEIVIRVGGVLEILEREIELRPNEYQWNYEGCFSVLPEAVLEKICAAADPIAMMDAFAIQHISPEKIAEMKTKIAGNPRILAWVKAGHDDLKEWWQQKLQDPKFDPFQDEDEETGGGA